MFIILHQLCALLDVVPFSNYEKTTPVKRTITATAGIKNENLASGLTNSLLFIGFLLDSNNWIYH